MDTRDFAKIGDAFNHTFARYRWFVTTSIARIYGYKFWFTFPFVMGENKRERERERRRKEIKIRLKSSENYTTNNNNNNYEEKYCYVLCVPLLHIGWKLHKWKKEAHTHTRTKHKSSHSNSFIIVTTTTPTKTCLAQASHINSAHAQKHNDWMFRSPQKDLFQRKKLSNDHMLKDIWDEM